MCGICGYINLDGAPADPEIVARMNATIVHRGPDDGGIFTDAVTALGHRRLSIIDLARGHQPMHLDGTPFTIVYNGEIYNHLELRSELGLEPEHFRTTCDTETILVAHERLGQDMLDHLQGMFAFAIYNARDRSLFIARDRLGIKPIYWFSNERVFVFGSEIKALLAHPEVRAQVNVSKLPQQLSLKYTLDDETLYQGIKKLLPGHTLKVENNRIDIQKYWDISYVPKQRFASIDAAAHEFRAKFEDSVRARLMSDVPLGVFLSGGIDSSVIAASMASMTDQPIKAFSIAFAQQEYSELPYSNLVARHVGADVREMVLSPQDWLAAWPRMVWHEDEPIAHPSSIPLHFVSSLAAQDVKVVLTGEGSDELMAGYERYYQTLANLKYGRFVPGGLRSVAQRLIDLLPDRFVPKRKAVRTSLYLQNDIDSLFLDNYAAFSRSDISAALQPAYQELAVAQTYSQFQSLMDASDAEELLDRILYADMKTYLLELLMKQDQMSMSASIESRVPFLDHRFVEFVCSLPTEYKLKGFDTKRILRKSLGETVPQPIVTRSKKGFPTPIREWFRGDFQAIIRDLLQSSDTCLTEFIRPDYIDHILHRHTSGKWDLQEQIWTLGNLELWLRIAIEGQDPETVIPHSEEALACVSSG